MSEKKKASVLFPTILIGFVALLVAAYAGFVAFSPKTATTPPTPTESIDPTASTMPDAMAPVAPPAPEVVPTPETLAQNARLVPTKSLTGPAPEPSIPVAVSPDPKVEEMMAAQKIGNDTAPIKVVEYSSLTCGHCASFHQTDFPRIKADYIDTGKVQFIFKEFPLNKPAMDASKLLRCLPRERYLNFMALLFAEQPKWAFTEDHLTPLKQNAKLAGLSDKDVTDCLNNKALEDRLVGDMQKGGEKYKIQSTPSFIVNDGLRTLIGHQPYGFFKETFDTLLNGSAPLGAGMAPVAPIPMDANGQPMIMPQAQTPPLDGAPLPNGTTSAPNSVAPPIAEMMVPPNMAPAMVPPAPEKLPTQ